MPDLSRSFLKRLKAYEPYLEAELQDDEIVVYSKRPGKPQVLELTVKRQYAENYEELELRTLSKLAECDVWRRFGSGKAYDDYLAYSEASHSNALRESFKKERFSRHKEDRSLWKSAIENAREGRITKEQVEKYHKSKVTEPQK